MLVALSGHGLNHARWDTYHEMSLGVELFWLHFFVSVLVHICFARQPPSPSERGDIGVMDLHKVSEIH